jgi:phosphodiesterase/alkaline phosphatase D-like protein
LANGYLTIIRWTTSHPGGSDEHVGVVQYGTDPKNLNETAKSHIRLNRGHSYTVFRVRLNGLKPKTTYYYKVTSIESNGKRDGEESAVPIHHARTRQGHRGFPSPGCSSTKKKLSMDAHVRLHIS